MRQRKIAGSRGGGRWEQGSSRGLLGGRKQAGAPFVEASCCRKQQGTFFFEGNGQVTCISLLCAFHMTVENLKSECSAVGAVGAMSPVSVLYSFLMHSA